MFNNKKIAKLEAVNNDLIQRTKALRAENAEITNYVARLSAVYQLYTGENTINELGLPKELVIDYDRLRFRSWEMLIKNHLAGLIVQKRVNWQIGSGLLFNAKPLERPFLDYYGNEEAAKVAQKKFIQDAEYLFRTFEKTNLIDYSKEKNLHELARHTDYNAAGDGDVLLIMRVKKGLPTIQVISGQCITTPFTADEIAKGNSVCEGVEFNESGEIVAYHVTVDTNLANGVFTPEPKTDRIGTKRIKAYFPGTKIRSAWLYKQSDLQKAGETRSMPLLTTCFETLKHLNDYLIANSKNAQLSAQMVIFFERDQYSQGEKVFNTSGLDSLGMSAPEDPSSCATDPEVEASANAAEYKLNGNGIVGDLPKGVKAKILNPNSQINQESYIKSTLQTLAAAIGAPYEVLVSSYNSNYTASMGARSDFQHTLDVLTELIPANQLYRKVYNMFIYLQVLSGGIECPPLLKAYQDNDELTIQAITNSTFEGVKLKPIDPKKFIESLRAQIPELYREHVPFNTLENLVNQASGGDFEGVLTQVSNEALQIKVPEEPQDPSTE
jgi:capsid protein